MPEGRGPQIRIGLIGCGTIAYWQHLRNLKRLPNVNVAGLADPQGAALERAARLVDAPRFATAQELLSLDALDAVVIASPAGLHAEHLLQACAAGKHVYVEKPLAHDAASLAAVQAGAAGKRGVFAVGYNNRFHPGCRLLRRRVGEGAIGEVRAVVSHFTESIDAAAAPEWRRTRRRGGGVLLDLATHHVDLYRWLLQDELDEVRIDTRTRLLEQDSASLRATTRGGVDVFGYFAQGGSRAHGIAVHGTAGVLQLDLHSGRFVALRNRRFGYGVRTRGVPPDIENLLWRSRKHLQPSYDPSHALALRAFVNAIANPGQRHPDLATFDDGAAALQAILNAEPRAEAAPLAHGAGPGPA
jgi:predicted dehydrogenase